MKSASFLRKSAVSLVVLGAMFSTAFGDSLKMSTSSYSNGSNGGSYTVTPLSGPANNSAYSPLAILSTGSFESFCLEPTEYFSSGSTYNYTIAGYAFGGANEAASRNIGPGDQLSLGTTWLYSQFATGTLSGFDYTAAGRKNSNLSLQRAIWYLEDDYSAYSTTALALANPFLSMVATEFGTLGAARGNSADGSYGVWALNLTSGANDQTQNQSQLYFAGRSVPDGGTTLALLGLGMLGVAWMKRRLGRA